MTITYQEMQCQEIKIICVSDCTLIIFQGFILSDAWQNCLERFPFFFNRSISKNMICFACLQFEAPSFLFAMKWGSNNFFLSEERVEACYSIVQGKGLSIFIPLHHVHHCGKYKVNRTNTHCVWVSVITNFQETTKT
jgi:hypothetical protein